MPVEVVEAVIRFVVGEDEQAAQHPPARRPRPGPARSKSQKGTEERSRSQAAPPKSEGNEIE